LTPQLGQVIRLMTHLDSFPYPQLDSTYACRNVPF